MQRKVYRIPSWLAVLTLLVVIVFASGRPPISALATEDALNAELVSQLGGASWAIAVQADYAYLGDGPRLVILDVSNPAQPVFLGQTDVLPGVVYGVAVSGSYAYVAGGYSGLLIIDVSNPAFPAKVGSFPMEGKSLCVAQADGFVYVGEEWEGLHIIDVSSPLNPVEANLQPTNGGTYGVAVDGDYAYVADGSLGLKIIDVSDPYAPSQVGWWDSPGHGLGVAAAGGYAYLADAYQGLRIIDVSNPSAPSEVAYNDTPGYAEAVAVSGGYAYVADGGEGLRVHDVSNPHAPFPVGFAQVPGSAWDVAVANGYAYVADVDAGLRVIDPADPYAPIEVGYYESPPAQAFGVAVAGSYAYVPGYGAGLRIIDISDPYNPSEVRVHDTPGHARDVSVVGGYAFVVDGYEGLRVINVSDPSAPYEVGDCDTPGYAVGLDVAGDYAYVADQAGGLRIIDVSNPFDPFEVGHFETPWQVLDVAVGVDHAYVAEYEGLRVLDVSNPADPFQTDWYDTPSHGMGVASARGLAFLANWDNGLRILNVVDPYHVGEVALVDTPGYAHGVAVSGLHAYVADMRAGLRIIDVSDPADPFEDGFYDTPGDAWNVTAAENLAYVADHDGGLDIVHFTGNVYTVSGNVHDEQQNGIEGVAVSDDKGHSDLTDANGDFEIVNVEPGTYTFVASKPGLLFSPPVAVATVPPDATIEFTGTLETYSVSGHVHDEQQNGIEGVAIYDDKGHSDLTDANGDFEIVNVEPGTYTFVASKQGWLFNPPSTEFTLPPNATVEFTGTLETFSVSGHVRTDGGGDVEGVEVSAKIGEATITTVATDQDGNYTITGLTAGDYDLVPHYCGYVWDPQVRTVTIPTQSNIDFVGRLPRLEFEPDRDGYGFGNGPTADCGKLLQRPFAGPWACYPDLPASTDFLLSDLQRMFGDECICEYGEGDDCVPKVQVPKMLDDMGYQTWKGHCDGMAVTSLRFFLDLDKHPVAPTVYDLEMTDKINALWGIESYQAQARQHITFYQLMQTVSTKWDELDPAWSKSGPTDTLCMLAEHMSGAAQNPMVLTVRPPHYKNIAHTVTPYAIEDRGGGIMWVKVYDSNDVGGTDNVVAFDLVSDTWTYDGSPPMGAKTIEVTPLSWFNTQPECPVKPPSTVTAADAPQADVWLMGSAHLLITDSLGRRMGFLGEDFVDEIPGATYRHFRGGGVGPADPLYRLPLTTTYTILIDGQTITETQSLGVSQYGPGHAAWVENVALTPGTADTLTIDSDGTQLDYEASAGREFDLGIALTLADGGDALRIIDADAAAGDALSLQADIGSGRLAFSHAQATGGLYGIEYRYVGGGGESNFHNRGIEIGATDTHYFDYGAWDGVGPMTLEIDHGSNGTIDETVQLENHAHRLYLPLILRTD